jgi:GTP cyclohydrolase II
MSNLKFDAIVGSGIAVDERIPIPDGLIPEDAQVEMQAKRAAGYFSEAAVPQADDLERTKGRGL